MISQYIHNGLLKRRADIGDRKLFILLPDMIHLIDDGSFKP